MLSMTIIKSEAYKVKQECTEPIKISLYTDTLVTIWGVVWKKERCDEEILTQLTTPNMYICGNSCGVQGYLCTITPSKRTMCLEDLLLDREGCVLYDPSNSKFVFGKYDLYVTNSQLYRFTSFNGGINI